MTLLAAHINDAGIVVVDAERVLYREPGFALLEDGRLLTGDAAYAQARLKPRLINNAYWNSLSTEPLADSRFRHLSAADLVSRQVEQMWLRIRDRGDRLVVAVPSYMTAEQLGLFLGIAGELGVPIVGLVDAAVAATRREYRDAVPVHVDFSLHGAMLTRIAQSDRAQADRTEVLAGSGVLALQDAWVRVIAEAFVRQSRFDPLHTAETEQTLYDSLPGWLAGMTGRAKVGMEVEYRGIRHEAELDPLELVAAAAPVYHGIVSTLRALIQADEIPALQLTDRAARMPGLADMLGARVGGELFLLEPGATARGLLVRCRDFAAGAGALSLLRQLPWDRAPVEASGPELARLGGRPTHLLFENTAYAIDGAPLTLGSHRAEAGRSIELRQDMPGVSRRHCTLQEENAQCTIRDYSRYGTFLNGHRIDGSAVLQVGDRIRLGTPGFELLLISTEADHGT